MREWIESRSESKRKACVERVASVNGKKSKICKAVDNLNLSLSSDAVVLNEHRIEDLAVCDKALQSSHGFIMLNDLKNAT
jgi:hypothetical protein